MHSYSSLFLLMAIAFLFACEGQSTSGKVERQAMDSLYAVVMEKHDEVMPEIQQMDALKIRLERKLKTLDSNDSLSRKGIIQSLVLLKKGRTAMFDWMQSFRNKHLDEDYYKNTPIDSLMIYLKAEEAKIEEVAEWMLESMDSSKAYLK